MTSRFFVVDTKDGTPISSKSPLAFARKTAMLLGVETLNIKLINSGKSALVETHNKIQAETLLKIKKIGDFYVCVSESSTHGLIQA